MLVLPIRTESVVHRPPAINYILIGINFLCFFAFHERFAGAAIDAWKQRYLCLHAFAPAFHEFFTYQFMHASPMHLLGNMLFLWVFGNSVNAKMGHGPYLAFYLAGGVFAGWAWSLVQTGAPILLGASGAVAAITTAYLALFPRSHVTVLVWVFFFIHFFEWPAMILILLKIIVWDNIVGPALLGSGNVAHAAHLAGYLFGFAGALLMLLARGLQRDQFDMLALWSRWRRRKEFASVMSTSGKRPAKAGSTPGTGYGPTVHLPSTPADEEGAEDQRFNELADRRGSILTLVDQGRNDEAAKAYEQFVRLDPNQCLPERAQLAVARALYAQQRFAGAAHAFERFVEGYARSPDVLDVRLLLGIIYARDLHRFAEAEAHLTQVLSALTDERRRQQCREWLDLVRSTMNVLPGMSPDSGTST